MTQTPDMHAAADVLATGDHAGLAEILTLVTTLEEGLAAIDERLPSAVPLDSKRIAGEIRAHLNYRWTVELPALIARYNLPADTMPA